MKVKVRYLGIVEEVIEVDDKFSKFADLPDDDERWAMGDELINEAVTKVDGLFSVYDLRTIDDMDDNRLVEI